MEYVYVDTALLAVPNYAVDQDTAAELIDRVLHFAALVEPQVPLAVVLSSSADNDLWANNFGPGFDEIGEFISLMGIGHQFSARDLTVLYNALLDRSVRSDAACPIEVREFSEFQAVPALPAGLSPVDLQSETQRILSTLAAIRLVDNGWHFGSGHNGPGSAIHISSIVDDATGEKSNALYPLPAAVAGHVNILTHARDLISRPISERIWEGAGSEDEIHLSITLGALDVLKSSGAVPDPSLLAPFSIGPGFIDSLRACQCSGSGRFAMATLHLCCQLVSGTCSRAIGSFGRPNQEQRTFDEAYAWRVHLTGGHEGLRLMYWQNGGCIEFANVGVKHELEIVLGAADTAASPDYLQVLAVA